MLVIAEALMVAAVGTLAAALAMATIADVSCRVIPNGCAAAVAASGAVELLASVIEGEGEAAALVLEALTGGATVLAVMLLAAIVSEWACGESGVGGGDVKLLGAVGVWLGPVWGLAVVAGSCTLSVAAWAAIRVSRELAARSVRSEEKRFRLRGESASRGIPLAPAVTAMALAAVLLKTVWGN